MKKILFASALAITAFAAMPAAAQGCGGYRDSQGGYTGPSANCGTNGDRYYGPNSGYQPAYNGGYNNPYMMPPPCIFSCGSRKPKEGELRTLADGTTVSYDKKSNRWLLVSRPTSQPRGVVVTRDVYVAN